MPRTRGRGARGGTPSRKLPFSKNGGKEFTPVSSPASSEASLRTSLRKSTRKAPKVVHKTEDFSYQIEDDSDSDQSVRSSDTNFSDLSSVASTTTPKSKRKRPLTPEEEIEPEISEPLNLPPSSDDILIQTDLLMQALQVYETVRHFHRILRISPFSFEDLCAALKADEQPCIIAEIHMGLLRALLIEDEGNGIVFGSADEKDSINIHFYLLDSFTWPNLIRSFISSDKDFTDLLPVVNDPSYPFVTVRGKLKVLTRLCDYFLTSNAVREEIINEGMFISDDYCRSCGRMGDLLCCELCPAVYHLACLKPPLSQVPDGDWLCPVCEAQKVKGVTDLLAELDKLSLYRNTALGVDRHRRKYWFMVRRVIV